MLKGMLIFAVAVILSRLFFIQIIDHDNWVEKAEEQHIIQKTIPAKRGEIYMMDGDEPTAVVMNEKVWTIIIDPMIAEREEVEKEISAVVPKEKMVAEWKDIFANTEMRYFIAARNVSRSDVQKLKEKALAGVWYQQNNKRVYPEGEMASQVLGFVNAEGSGQYGVEQALNAELSGENGVLKTVTDVNNVALSIGDDNVRVPAKDGTNIVLTIDRNIQKKTEEILAGVAEEYGSRAAALIMNPNTGEIMAIANVPTYDPANYGKVEDASIFLDAPLEVPYEPASICKTFAFSATIDQGKMTAGSTFTNTGEITVDGWPIKNVWKGAYGVVDMTTALRYSLNTGSVQALYWLGGSNSEITQTGKDLLYDYYYNHFGLGQYTGIELYESPGTITPSDSEEAWNSRYANMTFGQGLTLTMLQVATGFSSVINGGKYYTPTVVAGEITESGEFKQKEIAEPVRQTISEETSNVMRKMLYDIRSGRRASGVDKAGYYIGGKTGTAQAVNENGYTFDETIASYIGFGGAEGELPEYVIIVKIWEEGKKFEGDVHAWPTFDKINAYLLDYLQIKPGGQ